MTKVFTPDTFTATGVGPAKGAPDLGVVISVTGVATSTSGNVSATFSLEGSNDGTNWFIVGASQNISSGSSPQSASFTRVQFAFGQYRTNCTALAGTGAQLVTQIAVGS